MYGNSLNYLNPHTIFFANYFYTYPFLYKHLSQRTEIDKSYSNN